MSLPSTSIRDRTDTYGFFLIKTPEKLLKKYLTSFPDQNRDSPVLPVFTTLW